MTSLNVTIRIKAIFKHSNLSCRPNEFDTINAADEMYNSECVKISIVMLT